MLIWYILLGMLSIALVYGVISVYSIATRLERKVWVDPQPTEIQWSRLPRLAILLPFYRESLQDVETTFRSIAAQRYPRDRLRVVVVLEKEDDTTLRAVERCRHIIESSGLKLEIVVNESGRKSKARALNEALSKLGEWPEIVAVYDAGDAILDEFHLVKAATLIESGYVVVGSRVYRVNGGLIGRLSYIDSILWCSVALPGLTKFIGYPLVSGEGLVISARFLRAIGGFPEKLTEDSYITMLVAKHRASATLLNVAIYEGAPATIVSLLKQRLRWYRGYLECLVDLITKHGKEMNLNLAIRLALAYAEPIALIATMSAMIIVVLSPWITAPQPVYMLSVLIVISTFCAPLYLVINMGMRDLALFIAPLYWAIQGAIVIASIAIPKMPWLRTARALTYPLHLLNSRC